jgi:hypothetical protein
MRILPWAIFNTGAASSCIISHNFHYERLPPGPYPDSDYLFQIGKFAFTANKIKIYVKVKENKAADIQIKKIN